MRSTLARRSSLRTRTAAIATPPDVLVAMNPAGLKTNLKDLVENGTLIVNTGAFIEANLKKAGYQTNPLEDGTLVVTDNYMKVRIPAGLKRNARVNVMLTDVAEGVVGAERDARARVADGMRADVVAVGVADAPRGLAGVEEREPIRDDAAAVRFEVGVVEHLDRVEAVARVLAKFT